MDNKKKSPNKNVLMMSFPPEMMAAITALADERLCSRQDIVREAVSLHLLNFPYIRKVTRDG